MKTTRTLTAALLLLCLCGAASARQSAAGVQRVFIPGEKWALEVNLPGFEVVRDEMRGDGKGRRVMSANKQRGYVVTVFLETIPNGETAAELRDRDASGHKKSPINPTDFRSAEYKQIPTFEYTIKEYQGYQINQKHFNAYIVHGGFWAHIHLSKGRFQPGEEKLFYEIVDSAKFTESGAVAALAPLTGAAADLLREGSAHFLRGEYKQAVEPYRKALELEKRSPTLPRDLWHVLVDNLTMAYGISGDLKAAKETAEYGLSKDPDYPMFHYLMANIYAEMDDLDNTILYLKQAFARRKNVLPGERMPDPASDDSFKRFMKNEKFLAALKEINP